MTMKLIRRRKAPNPARRAFGVVRLALKGLVAQRVARTAYRRYRFLRRLPLIAAGTGVAAVVAKLVTGRKQPEAAYAPPVPATPDPAVAPAPTPAAGFDGAPSPAVEAATETVVIVETEATTPAHPAAAGTGGAEGEGVPTDAESAAESGESTDAPPPKND